MKKHITSLLTLALAFVSFSSLQAQNIGVIDVQRAFSEYSKTKDATNQLQDDTAKARKEINERWAAYKTKLDELTKLDKEIKDPILNDSSREKKISAKNSKTMELKQMQQEIREFERRRQSQIQEERMQVRKGLYDEINEIIQAECEKAGFDYVFDTSALSISQLPVILYTKDANDITDQVITALNASKEEAAPAAAE